MIRFHIAYSHKTPPISLTSHVRVLFFRNPGSTYFQTELSVKMYRFGSEKDVTPGGMLLHAAPME